MGCLLNHVCMSEADFNDYKAELENTPSYPVKKQTHRGHKEYWEWPALIITNVSFQREPDGGTAIDYDHTSISQKRLLKVLGLSQGEFKVEFNKMAPDLVPEISEQREV